jgi:hypothetical protein
VILRNGHSPFPTKFRRTITWDYIELALNLKLQNIGTVKIRSIHKNHKFYKNILLHILGFVNRYTNSATQFCVAKLRNSGQQNRGQTHAEKNNHIFCGNFKKTLEILEKM